MRKTGVKPLASIMKFSTLAIKTTTALHNFLDNWQVNTRLLHSTPVVLGLSIRGFYTGLNFKLTPVAIVSSPHSTTTTNYYYEFYIKEV